MLGKKITLLIFIILWIISQDYHHVTFRVWRYTVFDKHILITT